MKDLRKNQKTLFAICRSASLAGAVVGLGWLLVFIAAQLWLMASCMLALGLAALPCWLIARRGRFSLGLMCAQVVCITFTVAFSLVFDIPSAAAPRTTHLFLLVIALAGYVNFQRTHSRTQIGVLVVALLSFLVLSGTSIAFAVDAPPSDAFHAARAWINATLATLLLCAGIASMHTDFLNTIRNASELRAALENAQFELFYQPQVTAEGRLLGAEALLRWKHPKRGYISPADFIPLAESAGLMPALGDWVLRQACRTLARWQHREQTRGVTLSINITAEQFALPNFVAQLLQEVKRHSVPTELLKLELTESALLADIDGVIDKMQMLQSCGFAISLDDFGTGFSSLNYLRRLPLAQLKIDRSFIRGIDGNPRAAAIVKSIVQMGQDLSLDVVAEGVETEGQLHVMQSYGCKIFQGFLFARPMPLVDFERHADGNLA